MRDVGGERDPVAGFGPVFGPTLMVDARLAGVAAAAVALALRAPCYACSRWRLEWPRPRALGAA